MDNEGFTLLEMLISVFVISIILYMFVYEITNEVQAGEVRSAAFEVEALVEGARSCALANQSNSTVTVKTSGLIINCSADSYEAKLDEVELTSNFPSDKIEFSEKGIVKRGGTVNVCKHKVCEKVTIGIGKSKVNVL